MMRARAMSLIEVVASLVLLATTVTGLLVAHSRSLGQLANTRHQETATALAKQLMADWRIEPPAVDSNIGGRIESHPSWRWTRVSRLYPFTRRRELWEVTLTIYRADHPDAELAVGTYTWLERSDEQ